MAPKPRDDLFVIAKHECAYRYIVKERIKNAPLI